MTLADDAASVVTFARGLGRPLDRTPDGRALALPREVLDVTTVDPAALEVRESER